MPKYQENDLARHQIDRLLRYQATICSNLGTDSTKAEIKEANKKIVLLDRLIIKVDKEFYPSAESRK